MAALAEAAGIYIIVPDKRADTIYKDASVPTEIEKKIPEPNVELYLTGDE